MSEVAIPFVPRKLQAQQERLAASARPRTYPARIARVLALAHSLQKRVTGGEFRDYAAMARALGFTRARVTQLMDLVLLAPDVQAEVLNLRFPPGKQPICERHLRQVARTPIWIEQRARWAEIMRSVQAAARTPDSPC